MSEQERLEELHTVGLHVRTKIRRTGRNTGWRTGTVEQKKGKQVAPKARERTGRNIGRRKVETKTKVEPGAGGQAGPEAEGQVEPKAGEQVEPKAGGQVDPYPGGHVEPKAGLGEPKSGGQADPEAGGLVER